MNERTHFFIKIYLSHIIFERVVSCGWEVIWRRGQTATFLHKVLLTIAALLSNPGLAAQPWVTEGPKPSCCRWLSIHHLVPNWLELQLELNWPEPSVAPGYILFDGHLLPVGVRICTEFNHVHRSRWYSDIFDRMHLFRSFSAFLHRYISWSTALSRVKILHQFITLVTNILHSLITWLAISFLSPYKLHLRVYCTLSVFSLT